MNHFKALHTLVYNLLVQASSLPLLFLHHHLHLPKGFHYFAHVFARVVQHLGLPLLALPHERHPHPGLGLQHSRRRGEI